MSDDPLDRIPSHDRVSLRAVLVTDGEDPSQALSQAGIFDPIAIPVAVGDGHPDIGFGDGITPNLTAVLEPDQQHDDFGAAPETQPGQAQPAPKAAPLSGPVTANLPAAFGMKPLAPVRRSG